MGIQVSSTTRSSRDRKEMASHQIILVSWTSWIWHPFSAHAWSSLECDQLGRRRGLYTCLALFFCFLNSRSYYSAVKDIYTCLAKFLPICFVKKDLDVYAEQERQGCIMPHLLFSRQGREHRFCMTTSNQQQGRVTCAKDRYCRMIDGAHHWDYKINDNFGLSTARSYAMHPGQSWSHHAKLSLTNI